MKVILLNSPQKNCTENSIFWKSNFFKVLKMCTFNPNPRTMPADSSRRAWPTVGFLNPMPRSIRGVLQGIGFEKQSPAQMSGSSAYPQKNKEFWELGQWTYSGTVRSTSEKIRNTKVKLKQNWRVKNKKPAKMMKPK